MIDQSAKEVALANQLLLHALPIHHIDDKTHSPIAMSLEHRRADQDGQTHAVLADVFFFKRRTHAGREDLGDTGAVGCLVFRRRHL